MGLSRCSEVVFAETGVFVSTQNGSVRLSRGLTED